MTKEEFDVEYKKFTEVLNRMYTEDSEEPKEEYTHTPYYKKSDFIKYYEPKITDKSESETKFFSEDAIAKFSDEEVMLLPTLEKHFSSGETLFNPEYDDYLNKLAEELDSDDQSNS
jgi:hypothetical protein